MTEEDILIDIEFFESRRMVGEEFVKKLVEVFVQEAPKLVAQIKSTLDSSDISKLAELGHKLKGMCLNVGAVRLSNIGLEIEQFAKSGEIDPIRELVAWVDVVLNDTTSTIEGLVE